MRMDECANPLGYCSQRHRSFTSDPGRQPEEGRRREPLGSGMTAQKEVPGLGLCGVQGLPGKQGLRNKERRDAL